MISLDAHIYGLIDQLQSLQDSLNSPDVTTDAQKQIRSKILVVKLALEHALELQQLRRAEKPSVS